jgi:hypothetical protein
MSAFNSEYTDFSMNTVIVIDNQLAGMVITDQGS